MTTTPENLQTSMVARLESSLERSLNKNRETRDKVAEVYEQITGKRAWATLSADVMLESIAASARPRLSIKLRKLLNKP